MSRLDLGNVHMNKQTDRVAMRGKKSPEVDAQKLESSELKQSKRSRAKLSVDMKHMKPRDDKM